MLCLLTGQTARGVRDDPAFTDVIPRMLNEANDIAQHFIPAASFNAIASEFSGEQAQEYTRQIIQYHRIQGSPMMAEVAQRMVLPALKAAGLEARIEQFPSDGKTKYGTFLSHLSLILFILMATGVWSMCQRCRHVASSRSPGRRSSAMFANPGVRSPATVLGGGSGTDSVTRYAASSPSIVLPTAMPTDGNTEPVVVIFAKKAPAKIAGQTP